MPMPSYPPDLATEWADLRRRVRSAYAASQRRSALSRPGGLARLDADGLVPVESLPPEATTTGVHDVRAYGAVGDGATDDTAALQAALSQVSEAGGGTVWVPGGTYSIQAPPLRVHRNTRIALAPDAVVRRDGERTLLTNGDPGQDLPGHTGHGNILLEGGVWDGNAGQVPRYNNILSFGHADGITVRDTVVRDVPGYHAIEFNSSRRIRVDNVRFEGVADPEGTRSYTEAVQLDLAKASAYFGEFGPYDDTPCTDVTIVGCTFTGSDTPGVGPWPRGAGSHAATRGRAHSGVRVLGCHFENCTREGVHAYVWNQLAVHANTFTGCSGGVAVAAIVDTKDNDTRPPGWGDPTGLSQPVTDVVITGNTFTDSGTHVPVRLDGYPNGGWIDNVVITGNTVNGSASYGIDGRRVRGLVCTANLLAGTTTSAIRLDTATGNSISTNTVTGTDGTGFYLVSCPDTVVSGNVLRDLGHNGVHVQGGERLTVSDNQVSGAPGYGIRVSTGAADLAFTGNRVASTAEGLSITSTCRTVRRYGNDLRDSAGLEDASPDPVTGPGDLV
ncbi:right-handed parallel beta-helix repeat-containing protein [Nocardiopsis terrae]